MADDIIIIAGEEGAAADLGNVDIVTQGATRMLSGFSHGRVPLDSQKKSDAFAMADYARVTLALEVTAVKLLGGDATHHSRGDSPELFVTLEELVDGRWTVLHAYDAIMGPTITTRTFYPKGTQIRASWWFHAPYDSGARTEKDRVQFIWRLTGTAVPEAA